MGHAGARREWVLPLTRDALYPALPAVSAAFELYAPRRRSFADMPGSPATFTPAHAEL